jgi:hypothetical protein
MNLWRESVPTCAAMVLLSLGWHIKSQRQDCPGGTANTLPDPWVDMQVVTILIFNINIKCLPALLPPPEGQFDLLMSRFSGLFFEHLPANGFDPVFPEPVAPGAWCDRLRGNRNNFPVPIDSKNADF